MLSRRGFFKGLLGIGAGLFSSRCVQPMPEFALGGSQTVRHRIVNPASVGSKPTLPAKPLTLDDIRKIHQKLKLHSIKFNSTVIVNGEYISTKPLIEGLTPSPDAVIFVERYRSV